MKSFFYFCFFSLLCLTSAAMARDVPVRYMLANESVEQDAKFVKIAKDTVYLLPLDSAEIAEIQKKDEALLKQLEPDSVEEENQTGDMESDQNLNPLEAAEDSAMVADSLARVDSLARADSLAKAQADSAKIASASDFEAALLAQEKQAMEDSLAKEKAMADSIAAVSDSIRAVERQDSLDKIAAIPIEQKYIKIFKYELMRMTNLESGEAVNLSLSDFVFPELDDEEEPIYPEGNANLRVTSYPDSCEIYINGESLELFAPDTIRKIKPGKYTVSVRKMLKGVDWWGSKTIKINADSLNVVHIEVERPTTKLTVATIPDGVEVYVDEQPNESILPEYLTDVAIETEPSVQKIIYLRKVGYLDTALAVEVKAFMPNPVYVELEAVDNASVVEMQREYDRERAKRRIGRGLLWSSIAPIIAGGVFWYLAERDWSDAADKKSAYNKSAFESPDTQKLLKKNKDLNDSGDTKGLIGLGFGVVGVGLFVTGFVLAF